MMLLDVNVLLYALREDAAEHRAWLGWLEDALGGDEPVAVCNASFAAVVRLATHPRIFPTPTPQDQVFDFISAVRDAASFVPLEPGPSHWKILESLARKTHLRGNLISDVYLAALAIEAGAELVTADRDFKRFDGLRLHRPVDER